MLGPRLRPVSRPTGRSVLLRDGLDRLGVGGVVTAARRGRADDPARRTWRRQPCVASRTERRTSTRPGIRPLGVHRPQERARARGRESAGRGACVARGRSYYGLALAHRVRRVGVLRHRRTDARGARAARAARVGGADLVRCSSPTFPRRAQGQTRGVCGEQLVEVSGPGSPSSRFGRVRVPCYLCPKCDRQTVATMIANGRLR